MINEQIETDLKEKGHCLILGKLRHLHGGAEETHDALSHDSQSPCEI
jgi:hypothetical protein